MRSPHLPEEKHLNYPNKVFVLRVERYMILCSQEHILQRTLSCPSSQHHGGKRGLILLVKFADSIIVIETQDTKKKIEKHWPCGFSCDFKGLRFFSPLMVVPKKAGVVHFFHILSLQHQEKTWLNTKITSSWFYLNSYESPKLVLKQYFCSLVISP